MLVTECVVTTALGVIISNLQAKVFEIPDALKSYARDAILKVILFFAYPICQMGQRGS